MILIIVFFLPLVLLAKISLTEKGIRLNLYLFGLRIVKLDFVFLSGRLFVNGERKRKRRKSKYKIKVDPSLIKKLGLKVFCYFHGDYDPFRRAMVTGASYLLPNSIKVTLVDIGSGADVVCVFGKFTIFKIITSILTNTKIKKNKGIKR